MARKPALHSYSDRASFERLMLLIAVLIQHPGIGTSDPLEVAVDQEQHPLEMIQAQMQQLAQALEISLPNYSIHTLSKDLSTLRQYGILERRMYRQGYYLGTGVMNLQELQVAFNALSSQAKYQGDPHVRQVYNRVSRRLQSLNLERKGELFYPVRQHLNRSIVYTDPAEMMAQGKNQHTLFHQIEVLEQAIIQGQVVEISRSSDPYRAGKIGLFQLYPLQLIYYDIAWYLIHERPEDGHLGISRVNRFKDYCRLVVAEGRGVEAQKKSLQLAHKLLENGWGLFLGEPAEQSAELKGELQFETIKVRFYPPASQFILEGDRRHLHQQIHKGVKDKETGQPAHVDYGIKLPPRSLQEFSLWLYRHMDQVEVLSPPFLVEQHRQAAERLLLRY